MRYTVFGIVLWALIGLVPAAHAAIRCDGRLVSEGDRTYDLLKLCGEPDHREEIPGAYLPEVGLLTGAERWYYNPGPNSFVRVINIRSGRITDIDTAGYGFIAGAEGDCQPNTLRRGMTPMELLARCGRPAYKETRLKILPPAPPTRPTHELMVLEEWIYDFGEGYMTRVLTLVDGEVRRIESGRKY